MVTIISSSPKRTITCCNCGKQITFRENEVYRDPENGASLIICVYNGGCGHTTEVTALLAASPPDKDKK